MLRFITFTIINAILYNELLGEVKEITTPVEAPYAKHVYHIYAIELPNRDQIIHHLHEKGIGCGINYPIPINLQNAYRKSGNPTSKFYVAESSAELLLSLPMYPEITKEQIHEVVHCITDLLQLAHI